MLDLIYERFKEITSQCLQRKAKELNTDKKKLQLVLKLDKDNEVQYLIYSDYKDKIEELTFMKVLGVMIDFRGYSLFVPKFIKGALERFSRETSIPPIDTIVLICFDEQDKMFLWLYNKKEFVKGIDLESLFNPEDVIIDN